MAVNVRENSNKLRCKHQSSVTRHAVINRRTKLKATMHGGLVALENVGSAGRTRTYNPSVNSRMLCH